MQCLRTLVFLFISSSTLLSICGAVTKVEVLHQTTTVQGQPLVASTKVPDRSNDQQTIKFLGPQLKNGLQFTGSLIQAKNDYSNYIVQSETGIEKNLKSSFNSIETSGSIAVDYTRGQSVYSLNRSQTLSESPFSNVFHSASYAYQFNHQLSQIIFQHSTGSLSQPLTYFTDLRTAQRRKKPTELSVRSYTGTIDQVLTEKSKILFEVEVNEKSDRPQAIIYRGRSSYAFTQDDFLRADLAFGKESRDRQLQDDRGYFELSSYELSYSKYITYDWSAQARYGLVVEVEDNPQNSRKEQVATDIFGIDVGYEGKQWGMSLTAQQFASNVKFSSSSFGGRFSWNF